MFIVYTILLGALKYCNIYTYDDRHSFVHNIYFSL